MKGKLYESEYEEALIDMLHAEGWQYSNGKTIKNRPYREPLLVDELRESLSARYPELTSEDVEAIETVCAMRRQAIRASAQHFPTCARRLPLRPKP